MSLFDRAVVTGLPLVPKFVVGKVAARYVAGETLDSAVEAIRELNEDGASATVDLLGEEVTERATAEKAAAEYHRILERIVADGLDCNISVKPTQMGLEIDETFCRDTYDGVVAAAKEKGLFVRLDMEDHTTIDATLRIFRWLHDRYGNVGPVFQSYMRRTLRDIAEMPAEGANVRLCKGIYIEPREVAWQGYDVVRLNFLAALEKLLRQGVYVGIATHDEYLICGAVALVDKLDVPRDQYEFQMLLGVEPALRRILLAGGHPLRVYVPYGTDWYHYSVRRLRENPKLAGHVMRAMLRGE
ncbi:MAG: proline dehydrogenase family protein [Acidobacteriota bacterium]